MEYDDGTVAGVPLHVGEHLLRVGKDQKIRSGISYRFYLKAPDSILLGQNPLLAKMELTENLLGVEEI